MKLLKLTIILFISSISIIYAQDKQYLTSETCPFKIENIKSISTKEDKFISPRISPNGTKVLCTKSGSNGLYILNVESPRETFTITQEKIIGKDYSWTNDGNTVIYRAFNPADKSNRKGELFKYNLISNVKEKYEPINELKVTLNVRARKVQASLGDSTWFITSEQGGYYSFVISPDKKYVVVHGSHMYVYSIDGKEKVDTEIETGIATDWSDNNEYLLYYIQLDDGLNYTGSDLFICTSDGMKKWKLTDTEDIWEARPTWSIKGKKIVFMDYKSNKLFVGDLIY